MVKRVKTGLLYFFCGAFVLLILFTVIQKDWEHGNHRAVTCKSVIRGIIIRATGRSSYSNISVNDSSTWFSFDVRAVKMKKGFGEYDYYAEGDSIIKDANTDEVTIKRGNNVCILKLVCD